MPMPWPCSLAAAHLLARTHAGSVAASIAVRFPWLRRLCGYHRLHASLHRIGIRLGDLAVGHGLGNELGPRRQEGIDQVLHVDVVGLGYLCQGLAALQLGYQVSLLHVERFGCDDNQGLFRPGPGTLNGQP